MATLCLPPFVCLLGTMVVSCLFVSMFVKCWKFPSDQNELSEHLHKNIPLHTSTSVQKRYTVFRSQAPPFLCTYFLLNASRLTFPHVKGSSGGSG